MDITIVNISKGPYELNEEALKEYNPNELSFSVTTRLRYSSESDYVGFQIDLIIMQDKIEVFKSGFLVGMAIADWGKDLQNGLDLTNNRWKLNEICKTAWLVATGIVALQSSNANFNGIMLPSINYEGLSNDVILLPSSTK
jgi:hypothetical protein